MTSDLVSFSQLKDIHNSFLKNTKLIKIMLWEKYDNNSVKIKKILLQFEMLTLTSWHSRYIVFQCIVYYG